MLSFWALPCRTAIGANREPIQDVYIAPCPIHYSFGSNVLKLALWDLEGLHLAQRASMASSADRIISHRGGSQVLGVRDTRSLGIVFAKIYPSRCLRSGILNETIGRSRYWEHIYIYAQFLGSALQDSNREPIGSLQDVYIAPCPIHYSFCSNVLKWACWGLEGLHLVRTQTMQRENPNNVDMCFCVVSSLQLLGSQLGRQRDKVGHKMCVFMQRARVRARRGQRRARRGHEAS